MRKHFLILMLMALLPFTAWAEGEPTAKQNLVYDGSAQELLNAGTTTGKYFFYAAVLNDAAKPGKAAYDDAVPSKTNAADYDVYYVMKDADEAVTDAEAAAAVRIDASIATRPIASNTIVFKLSSTAVTETNYTGAAIDLAVEVGGATTGFDYTWSSFPIKNAGSYTVTVQKKVTESEVVFVNEEGTADFLVNKVPLNVNAKHVTITYGDDAVENNVLYTATGWKGTDATDPDVNNLVVNVNFGGAQPTNAGVHPFTITAGTVNNYTVTVSVANANLTIEKKDLEIKAVAGAGFDYGEVTSYAPTFTYTGLLDSDKNTDGTPKDGVLKSAVTFTAITAGNVNFFDGNGNIDGNAGSYVVTPVVEGVEVNNVVVQSDNYDITCTPSDANLVVSPKSFKHTHVTIDDIASQEYKNAAWAPTITITDSNVYGQAKTLNAVTDYTVTWDDNTLTNAGTYTATITAGTNGNYAVPVTNPATTITKTFKINPAPLTVVIKTKEEQGMTKVFDGNEFSFGYTFSNVEPYPMTSTDAEKRTILQSFASIYGVKNNENLSTVFTKVPVLSYTAKSGSKVNVNDYVVTVADQTNLSSNYDVYIEDGSLSITKMPIWIKAKDTKKTYGKAEPDLTYVVLPTAESAEGAALTPNSTYIQTAPTFEREQGENVGTFAITKKTDAVAKGNYEIKGYVDGIFTIELATLRIVAENKEQVYNGTIKEELTYKVYGLVEGDQVTGVTVAIAATANNGTSKSATGDAGIYALTPSGAVVTNASTGADATGNYKAVAYQEGTYTINAKSLVVTAKNQGLLVGEMATALDNTLVEFDDLIESDKGKVTAVLGFSADVVLDNGAIDAIANQTEIDANGVIVGGIRVQGIAGARAFNYDVTAPAALVAGNLLITDGSAILALNLNYADKATWDALDDATKTHNSDVIAAANDKKAKVTFDDFEMKAEKWYPMVLPFKTTVAELSSKLGYAVVNILNKDNTDDAIRFKLHMQEIEANQPFLIKIASDKVLGNGDLVEDANEVWFTNKTIASQDYSEDENMNTHIKFVGFYDAKIGVTAHDFWFSHLPGYDARYGGTANPDRYLRPLNAFVHTPDGSIAKVIYVEDPNSGVTAIQAISAEGAEAIPVQGWYTVNGVKLQGVPTEKGIYINNGKKVVIK